MSTPIDSADSQVSATTEVVRRPSLTQRLSGSIRSKPATVLSPLSLVVVLILWEAASRADLVSPLILPAPSRVWEGLTLLLTAPWFPRHVWITTIEVVLGFVIGSGAGILLAIAMVNLPLFRQVIAPYIIAFQVTPKVVLAPIFITWFGFGIESKIALAVAMSFFPVVINTVVGLEAVEENSVLLMRSLVASRRQIFTMLAWPTALPSIFGGLKIALTLSLIGALVGEFITAKDGLGVLITTFSFELKVYIVFGLVIVISVLALALYGLMEYLDRKVVFWRHSNTTM